MYGNSTDHRSGHLVTVLESVGAVARRAEEAGVVVCDYGGGQYGGDFGSHLPVLGSEDSTWEIVFE